MNKKLTECICGCGCKQFCSSLFYNRTDLKDFHCNSCEAPYSKEELDIKGDTGKNKFFEIKNGLAVEINYGVFVYSETEMDSHIYSEDHYVSLIEAKKYYKYLLEHLEKNQYVELWKKDKGGLWGNSGEPILKSDG